MLENLKSQAKPLRNVDLADTDNKGRGGKMIRSLTRKNNVKIKKLRSIGRCQIFFAKIPFMITLQKSNGKDTVGY